MAIKVQRQSSHIKLVISLVGVLCLPVCAIAQQAIVQFQLSFSDPGARSMGFGGAFVALADDATAAFANPAGLTQLLKPELSIEARNSSYSSPYTQGGRLEGFPSDQGLDSTAGLRTTTSKYDVTGLSFLSLAYPGDNWSLALYRHNYANFEFRGETQGLYGGGTSCCQTRWDDQKFWSDIDIVSYGLSAAYRVNDSLDIGMGIIYYDASFVSRTTEYLWDEDTPESFLAPTSFLPERSVISERIYAEDTDWAFTGGFLWRLTDKWSIGGIYREKMEIDLAVEVVAGQAIDFGVPPGSVIFEASGLPIEFPDFYGLGFAYRNPDGRLTLSFQWDRIEYSNIPDSLLLDDQTMDDTNELHLGGEYVFLESTPIIALRLGAWFEPDHQMRATVDEPLINALLRRGDDDIHYAAGLGIATERFQIDLAVDFADRADILSLSTVFNF